jgi:hypothetical protein
MAAALWCRYGVDLSERVTRGRQCAVLDPLLVWTAALVVILC